MNTTKNQKLMALIKIGGTYKNNKTGDLYTVLGFTINANNYPEAENGDLLVRYQRYDQTASEEYSRSVYEFLELVYPSPADVIAGRLVPRFQLINT